MKAGKKPKFTKGMSQSQRRDFMRKPKSKKK